LSDQSDLSVVKFSLSSRCRFSFIFFFALNFDTRLS
jgi:hypothetical protein